MRTRAGEEVSRPVLGEFFYPVALALLAVFTALLVTKFALGLHRNFLTIACDTAVLQSAIVNTLHGHFLGNNGLGGPSILGSHTTFLLLLIIPIYLLAPSADTLFILQVWGVYSTVVPLYLVARIVLGRPFLAFFIASAALASPFLLHMALAPFHLETWIAAAALWSLFFYHRNNMAGFMASLLFAVCCGEQAALIYVSLGAALLLTHDEFPWRKRYGWTALIAGLVWLLMAIAVIEPMASGRHQFNIFAYNYAPWGVKSAAGLPLALAAHPLQVLAQLTDPTRWLQMVEIVGLLLIACFLSWRSLILLAPLPVYLLMSRQEFFLNFHAYYFSFAFVAGTVGLLACLRRQGFARRFAAPVLSATFLVNIFLLWIAMSFYLQMDAERDDPFSSLLHQEFSQIPREATVYTPHRYSAYLSNRENMVIGDLHDKNLDFTTMMNSRFADTNVHPEQVDYIVCDLITDQCGWRGPTLGSEGIENRTNNVEHLVQSAQWRMIWNQNSVVILKRTAR
jgi:uncharacterized membrane protein